MKIRCLFDKLVNIQDLKPHPQNKNIHPKNQIQRLAEILDYQGWRYPIKVSKLSGFVTSGHGRIEAAKLNKWTEVPINYQEYETQEQEYADLVADNSIALWAEIDQNGVLEDIKKLPDIDIKMLGFEDFKIPDLDKNQIEDEVPEVKETDIKVGDLFQLGNHRLLCGDCTIKESVELLMNGEKADMVFTDPPYGMNLDTDYSKMHSRSNKTYKKIINDNKPFDAKFILEHFNYCKEIFLWGADYYKDTVPLGGWLVWNKRNSEKKFEEKYCHNLQEKNISNAFELCWSKQSHKRIIYNIFFNGSLGEGDCEERTAAYTVIRHHPTQKPVLLCERFLIKYSKEQNNIVDLFGGSGSTLIACEKTNRKCFTMEIDPQYCQGIIDRYKKYSSKEDVVKLN